TGRGKFFAQQLRGVLLDHDFGFEVQAGGKAEELVRGPGIAVDAPMLAAAIRVDAGLETDVGAVVVGDEGGGVIFKELRARQRVLLRVPIRIPLHMDFFEAVGRVAAGAARRDWLAVHQEDNSVACPEWELPSSLLTSS